MEHQRAWVPTTLSEARYRALDAGARAFLTKPFEPSDLREAIDSALAFSTGRGTVGSDGNPELSEAPS